MNLTTFLIGILAISSIYIVIYKWYFLSVFVQYKDPSRDQNPHLIPIFLVISVKNEANRLEGALKSVLRGAFLESSSKIIVVDDHSSDSHRNRMEKLCEGYDNVEFLVSNVTNGKKHAIRYAIDQFSSDHYAFIDADCRVGKGWYSSICRAFSHGDFVLGYAPFTKKQGLLNSLQRFEGLWVASQYMAYAIRRMPYMAVGRNMAISGKVLKETIPKMKADHLLSGDDDMLVQALHNDTVISCMLSPDSFVVSDSESTYTRYLAQRTRQISTSVYYKPIHKMLLGGISFAMMLFYGCVLASLFVVPAISLSFFAAMAIINVLFFWVPTQKFASLDLRWKVLYLDIIYTFNLYVLGISSLVRKGGKWK